MGVYKCSRRRGGSLMRAYTYAHSAKRRGNGVVQLGSWGRTVDVSSGLADIVLVDLMQPFV